MKAVVLDFDGPLFDGRGAARKALVATAEHFRDRFSLEASEFDRLPLLRPRPLMQLVSSELGLNREQLDEIERFYRQRLAGEEDAP